MEAVGPHCIVTRGVNQEKGLHKAYRMDCFYLCCTLEQLVCVCLHRVRAAVLPAGKAPASAQSFPASLTAG